MIISHEHRFISIKSGKTASTSVEKALAQICGPQDVLAISENSQVDNRNVELSITQAFKLWLPVPPRIKKTKHRRWRRNFYDHIPAYRLRRIVDRSVWDGYTKMTVVRNPFDRALSNYFWNNRNNPPADDLEADINRYVLSMSHYNFSLWEMFALRDRMLLDVYMRYERLDEDFRRFVGGLGIDPVPALSHEKSGFRPKRLHYRDVLSPESRRLIETHARREFECFGYEW